MPKTIVLDANILIRAVLGSKVASIIAEHADQVVFVTVEEAFTDAHKYVPQVISKRHLNQLTIETALTKLSLLERLVATVPTEVLTSFEQDARQRLRGRDEDDWPYLALALRLDCPIWTEDTDFFGCGVATWTSDRIEIFLGDA